MANRCENCGWALMLGHPDYKLERLKWLKCPVCGFCKQTSTDTHDRDKVVQDSESYPKIESE